MTDENNKVICDKQGLIGHIEKANEKLKAENKPEQSIEFEENEELKTIYHSMNLLRAKELIVYSWTIFEKAIATENLTIAKDWESISK